MGTLKHETQSNMPKSVLHAREGFESDMYGPEFLLVV